MIVCPLCEHTQQSGEACEACGKVLAPAAPAPVATAPLPELEGTQVSGARLPAVIRALPELERTGAERVDVEIAALPGVEQTRAEAAPDVPVAPLPEVDRGRSADDGVRTALPAGAITCRYCRNVQASGTLCDRCGMALPRVKAAAPAPGAPPGARKGETVWARCKKCGATARAGERCGDCGHPVPLPES